MAILNNNPLVGASGNQGGYNINNSLRFRASASAYLNRTPPSTGNNITWTYSGWVKRGKLGSSQDIFGAGNLSTIGNFINFTTSDTVDIYYYNSGYVWRFVTTQVFRDPSAWYHIVVAYDATQATNTNRLKLYVNGVQVTAFSTATYPALNQTVPINSGSTVHYISDTANYFDGYLADVNFIDGQALTPSSFGETDTTTGVWKPKAYSGTYGTNGFYLKFSDIATTSGSNAGLGKDFSGNSNYWTTNNISVTSGTTYDAMTDSPTNTSATVANYCVANPLDKVSADSTSQGNLLVTVNGGAASGVRCNTVNFTSITGKWYWEGTVTADSVGRTMFSMKAEPCNISSGVSSLTWYWRSDGVTNLTGVGTFTTNDVIMFAYDSDTGKMWAGKNGTWLNSGVPASGTGQVTTLTALAAYALALSCDTGGAGTGAVAFNYGQRPFSYTPPTGFNRVNTYNLPAPTILQGNKYMDATLYTGNGSTQTIVNQGQFKPDFVWVKRRDGAGQDHVLQDSNRGFGGTTKLASSSTAAENTTGGATGSEWGSVTAANSNGFSITASTNGDQVNKNTWTYVGWQWQAGQGTTSSNTSGSITSTVSVNTTAGFSIVSYTEPASGSYTVGHGLGVAPKMIILRERPVVTNWLVWHNYWTPPTTRGLYLNSTSAAFTTGSNWLNSVTSSVFGITVGQVTGGGSTTIAYCFAEIAGFSKFGSYVANGSADNTFVYTGFRPKYIMVKCTTAPTGYESWFVFDSVRNTYNSANAYLNPNNSNAEGAGTAGTDYMDLVSNGFKLRGTGAPGVNGNSGATYIYAAFAENPFKNSLAR